MKKSKTIYPDPIFNKRELYLREVEITEFQELNSTKYFIKLDDEYYFCTFDGKVPIFWSGKEDSYTKRIALPYFKALYQQLIIYLMSGKKTKLESVI